MRNMTETDVREFLRGFQAEELAGKGILRGRHAATEQRKRGTRTQ